MLSEALMGDLKMLTIFVAFTLDQLRQDCISSEPTSGLQTENKIASCPRSSSIAIDERVNVVEPPKHICG